VSRGAVSIRVVVRWLARGALVAAWALVGWGTLLLLVTLANAAGRGPRAALAVLLPAAGGTVWDILNGFSAAFAGVAWLTLAGLLFLWRRQSPHDPGETSAAAAPLSPLSGEGQEDAGPSPPE